MLNCCFTANFSMALRSMPFIEKGNSFLSTYLAWCESNLKKIRAWFSCIYSD